MNAAPDPLVTDNVVDELCWQLGLPDAQAVRLTYLNFILSDYTLVDVEQALKADCWKIPDAIKAGVINALS